MALGRFDEARRRLARAIGQGVDGLACAATALESLIDLSQGGLATARLRLECYAPAGTQADSVRALVLYESGELAQAQRVLTQNLSCRPDDSPADAWILSRLLMARIAWAWGDQSVSHHHLAVLEQTARDKACHRIRCSVWIERARVATLDGRAKAAAQALAQVDRYGDWADTERFFVANDVDTPTIAHVRLHIAQGRFDQAIAALQPDIEHARQRGRLRRTLKLRLLLAMALDGQGRQNAAMAQLSGVLPFAYEEGWCSTFVEEGPRLAALLRRLTPPQQVQGFVDDLLKRFAHRNDTPSRAEIRESAALTERECQVIRLVARGHPIITVAEHLQLSAHTVKVHLRNLYRKLHAHGQAQAVAIARARGLLDCPSEAFLSQQHTGRLGPHHGLGASGDAQFFVDVLDVCLDRIGRDVQALADLTV
jgi:LuxR family maltose regulon positive regulatory protein